MELNDVVSSGIAFVAVLVSIFALKHSNRSVKAANEANDLSKMVLDMQKEADRRSWVQFDLKALGRGRYELRNKGTKTAPDVLVDLGDLNADDENPTLDLGDFPPGRVEQMYLVSSFDTQNEKVRVMWRWDDGTIEDHEFLVH